MAVVRRMKDAGFVVLGKSNTPEFGSTAITESDLNGACRNPWDTTRTPGGSSGGAAAAVSSGALPLAHGSDGGGSIRIPAGGLRPVRVEAVARTRLGRTVRRRFARARPERRRSR